MKRREVLRLLGLGIPAGIIFPSMFTSCKDDELFSGLTYGGKVIIVGAGISGLYAALLLKKRKVDVTILEASNVIGGRIRSLENFSDFPVELGAEEIHGQRSVWYDMVRSTGSEFASSNGLDFIRLDNELRRLMDVESDSDIQAIDQLIEKLSEYNSGDITADQYIAAQGIPARVQHYFNALLANENGTSTDRISMQGIAEADAMWTSGDKNMMLRDRSFMSIINEKLADVIPLVTFSSQVRSIDYSGSTITLTDQNSNTYTADRVIITTPLTVLRDGDITFTPALSADRTAAFSRIGMGAGMKILLRFQNRFWDYGTGSIYSDGVVPEYWSTGGGGRSPSNTVLTAFVHGAKAEYLQSLGGGMINAILSDLDNMYGTGTVGTAVLQATSVMNWGTMPFIRGTYSYPKPGSSGARELIAAPLQNKIFFAGEATHTRGHFATVHGAMETGIRAVDELFKSI